ncbi:MAG: endonuclease/exonuclease/phosphatase family protein [Tannerella sp.]|jgi:endonuclease/exonuclease/phosphatase family metal-dependent hydrolase|nr:endonuclease/exonuclease/phosphatase family protein [Tannerella sp.]
MKRLLSTLLLCGLSAGVYAADTLKIMSYNVRNANGMDNVTDYGRIADVILKENPDAVAIQELDSVTGRSGGVNVLHEIARLTAMHGVFNASIVYDGGKYGVGVISREKPLGHYAVALPGREEKRSLLIVEFEKYLLGCTHFSLTDEDRLLSIDIIKNESSKAVKPFILAGDLNSNPDSEVINRLNDGFTTLNNPLIPTFPSDRPRHCIDYIAVARHVPFTLIANSVVVESVASDHRPVIIVVALH